MIISLAIFNVKKGKVRQALKHMKHRLKLAHKVPGFIHGYVSHSEKKEREFLVIEEYETQGALNEMQMLVSEEAKQHPDKYMSFMKLMLKEPFISVYRKHKATRTKMSTKYRGLVKKLFI